MTTSQGVTFQNGLEDTIAKLAQIEGEAWAVGQEKVESCNVGLFYEAWKQYCAELGEEYCQEHSNEVIDPSMFSFVSDNAIYGNGGYSRYIVRLDGEVVALKSLMSDHRVKLAEAVGIRFG